MFLGAANFRDVEFGRAAKFRQAHFDGDVKFWGAAFSTWADFKGVKFQSGIDFWGANFHRWVYFDGIWFRDKAGFRGVTFKNDAVFENTRFEKMADFTLATFGHVASFDDARFQGPADFKAIRSERAFSLSKVEFDYLPDFTQAHFEEAPRLDHVRIKRRMIDPIPEAQDALSLKVWFVLQARRFITFPRRLGAGAYRRIVHANSSMPARWRALRRLAIQGHDTDRELEFHAGEVRAARFASDWPLPLTRPKGRFPQALAWLNSVPFVFWRSSAWAGCFQFWAGLAYQIFSNFGRSLMRPLVSWALAIVFFSTYYLAQTEEMALRQEQHKEHWWGPMTTYARSTAHAWNDPPACFRAVFPNPPLKDAQGNDKPPAFTGLVEPVAKTTNMVREAVSLSLHNAFIVLDSNGESAHRTYGCLYGVERYGDNPVAFVPREVSLASGAQKLFSAIMIFLFGLALRNMLKMK